jgi:hypothetical protein
LVNYLYEAGKMNEAKYYLESALKIDFSEHILLYEFAPYLNNANEITELIELYRK